MQYGCFIISSFENIPFKNDIDWNKLYFSLFRHANAQNLFQKQ